MRLVKIVPPVWMLSFLSIGLLLHFFVPATRVFDISSPISFVAAGAAFAVGLYLTLRASNIFAIEKTEILPASDTNRVLITRGPFRLCRNPMYLGMILELLGVALYVGTLPLFLTVIAHFLVLNFVFIPFEEEKLHRIFGVEYETYKNTVRRWI